MLFISSYSHLFKQYVFLFIVINGLFLTYVTGIFNLNSTAKMTFNWLFFDPWLWAAIVYVDHFKLVDTQVAAMLYCVYAAQLSFKYLAFMSSVISQLTAYLGINFVTVQKQKAKLQ